MESTGAMLDAPRKKARTPVAETSAVGNGKCSSPALISCFTRPDAQEQNLTVLMLLASGYKHARFEVPSEEASAPMLKFFISCQSTERAQQRWFRL